MFGFGKSSKQAKRKIPTLQSSSFQWRKSYHWLWALIPVLMMGSYLTQMDQLLPIRTIQLSPVSVDSRIRNASRGCLKLIPCPG